MISAIFFDFSGTLVSGELDVPACRKSVATHLRSNGYRVCTARYIRSSEARVKELVAARSVGLETRYEDFMRGILGHLGISDEALIKEIEQIEFSHYHWSPTPNVRSVLRGLSKEYRLGIISNGMTDSAVRVLRKERLLSLFETVVISRDVGFRKPHPIIFNRALADLGVVPREAVFVGDNAFADVLGARKAGMCAIWVTRRARVASILPMGGPLVRIAASIEDVPSLVRQLDSSESSGEAYHPLDDVQMVTPSIKKGD